MPCIPACCIVALKISRVKVQRRVVARRNPLFLLVGPLNIRNSFLLDKRRQRPRNFCGYDMNSLRLCVLNQWTIIRFVVGEGRLLARNWSSVIYPRDNRPDCFARRARTSPSKKQPSPSAVEPLKHRSSNRCVLGSLCCSPSVTTCAPVS